MKPIKWKTAITFSILATLVLFGAAVSSALSDPITEPSEAVLPFHCLGHDGWRGYPPFPPIPDFCAWKPDLPMCKPCPDFPGNQRRRPPIEWDPIPPGRVPDPPRCIPELPAPHEGSPFLRHRYPNLNDRKPSFKKGALR